MEKAARKLLRRLLPLGARVWLANAYGRLNPSFRHASEDEFWDRMQAELGSGTDTDYYREFMLKMSNLPDESFFAGKAVVDIGCGPRGSLTWLDNAKAAIGLDTLAERYTRFGTSDHPNMIYLQSPSERMPFPSGSIDVVISMNSLDHVDDLAQTCREIRRVLKPGGHFLGSLNLEEPPTVTEPYTLTESWLRANLLSGWEEEFCLVRPRVPSNELWGPYKYFLQDAPPPELLNGKHPMAMWCRFRKPIGATASP